MKVGVRMASAIGMIALPLVIGVPLSVSGGVACDCGDGDGIPDVIDKCSQDSRNLAFPCDTDQDGYGNVCDGDFNQSQTVTAIDYTMFFLANLPGGMDTGRGTDMNCSGTVNAIDYTMFFLPQNAVGKPGPSGLACAGMIPCN